jgi:oligopeptidase B
MSLKPPSAAVKPYKHQAHGESREDPYYWLREKSNPEVIEYLEAENAYTDQEMAGTRALQDALFQEMKSRIQETDSSAPVQIDDYFYYARTEAKLEYPIYCRKRGSLEGEEEVLLDHNKLAQGKEHSEIGAFEVSPDHSLLAYSLDEDGSEKYTIYVKDLLNGELFDDVIPNTRGSIEWFNDSKTILYAKLNQLSMPGYVMRHRLGSDREADAELYHEKDDRFFLNMGKSRSKKYLFIMLASKQTSETYYLDADNVESEPTLIEARRDGHEYFVAHHDDIFYILTNYEAQNFRIMQTSVADPAQANWFEVVPHRADVTITELDVFAGYLVIYERSDVVKRVRVRDLESGEEHYIAFDEESYSVGGDANPNYNTKVLRFVYSSPVTPATVIDYDMKTRTRTIVKREAVLGDYDPSNYVVERLHAIAPDGTEVPVSVAYHKDTPIDGSAPCWLYGYGSYGLNTPPSFNKNRISLLDKGFVFAIAHIRGGEEKGRGWYLDGKYLNKKNTFTDYIAAAEHLITHSYSKAGKLVGYGGSAGGLLMGAVANMRPDLFGVIIANVPFVDALNTMSDPTIPLTVMEYEEWGNPDDKQYYEYIKSYSPYDNVVAQEYPHMLVLAGLNDPRVQYWEPAKWVAKLRAMKTDTNTLLLRTQMGHGHGGATGRYEYLKEIAFEYAFALRMLKCD